MKTGGGLITSVQLLGDSVSCFGLFLVRGWGLFWFLSWLALEILVSVQTVKGMEC